MWSQRLLQVIYITCSLPLIQLYERVPPLFSCSYIFEYTRMCVDLYIHVCIAHTDACMCMHTQCLICIC